MFLLLVLCSCNISFSSSLFVPERALLDEADSRAFRILARVKILYLTVQESLERLKEMEQIFSFIRSCTVVVRLGSDAAERVGRNRESLREVRNDGSPELLRKRATGEGYMIGSACSDRTVSVNRESCTGQLDRFRGFASDFFPFLHHFSQLHHVRPICYQEHCSFLLYLGSFRGKDCRSRSCW